MDSPDYTRTLLQLRRQRSRRHRIGVLLRTYSWLGLLMSIVAIGYFLLASLPVPLSREQALALAVAGVGGLLSIMSRTLIVYFKEREEEEAVHALEFERVERFLFAWRQFERASKNLVAKQDDDLEVHSLRAVISALYDGGVLDLEDMIVLEEGLEARNSIVHSDRPTSARAMDRLTASLTAISRKIAL